MSNTKTVFVQNWTEYERGWGTRPDGFTVHTSKEQLDSYVKWYNKTFNNLPRAPDDYTVADGVLEVEVDDALYQRIHKATQEKVGERTIDCVHGKGRYFETSPMRALKDDDIKW